MSKSTVSPALGKLKQGPGKLWVSLDYRKTVSYFKKRKREEVGDSDLQRLRDAVWGWHL